MLRLRPRACVPALLAWLCLAPGGLRAADPAWPQWRGPQRDGVAGNFTTPARWPAALTRRWSVPVGLGRTVLVSGQSMGVTAFAPVRRGAQWDTETLWENAEASMYMSNGVVVEGVLYGLSHKNSGQWFSIDATTGKTLWMTRGRDAGNAAVVSTGRTLVQLKDDGELLVTPPSRDGFAPAHRYQVAESATWAQPVLDGRRVFIRDESHLTLWLVE